MKTAEEIIREMQDNIGGCFADCIEDHKEDVVKAMKDYAQQECQKVRRDCADNAKICVVEELIKSDNPFSLVTNKYTTVDKQSILSTKIELT